MIIIKYTRESNERFLKELNKLANGDSTSIYYPYKPNEDDERLVNKIIRSLQERKSKNGTN